MAAAAWSNVTENANVPVQRGTPECTVKTLLQQKHYVRDTIETFICNHTFNTGSNLLAIV